MSQSDYLKHKKMATVLKSVADLDPVLMSGDYTSFVGYSLDKQIGNIASPKVVYSKLIQPTYQRSFSMDLPHKNLCMGMTICKNTNSRPNRVLLSDVYVQSTAQIMSTPAYVKVNYNTKDITDLPLCQCSDF